MRLQAKRLQPHRMDWAAPPPAALPTGHATLPHADGRTLMRCQPARSPTIPTQRVLSVPTLFRFLPMSPPSCTPLLGPLLRPQKRQKLFQTTQAAQGKCCALRHSRSRGLHGLKEATKGGQKQEAPPSGLRDGQKEPHTFWI